MYSVVRFDNSLKHWFDKHVSQSIHVPSLSYPNPTYAFITRTSCRDCNTITRTEDANLVPPVQQNSNLHYMHTCSIQPLKIMFLFSSDLDFWTLVLPVPVRGGVSVVILPYTCTRYHTVLCIHRIVCFFMGQSMLFARIIWNHSHDILPRSLMLRVYIQIRARFLRELFPAQQKDRVRTSQVNQQTQRHELKPSYS